MVKDGEVSSKLPRFLALGTGRMTVSSRQRCPEEGQTWAKIMIQLGDTEFEELEKAAGGWIPQSGGPEEVQAGECGH